MKNLILPLLFFIFITSCNKNTTPQVNASLQFETLSCNAQLHPNAVDTQAPVFSWIVRASGFNRNQTAYQLLVATDSVDFLNKNNLLWDTGKIESSNSTHVTYGVKPLFPNTTYYWKVKIWDEKEVPSDWSAVQRFETGLLQEANWGNAKWISLKKDTRTSEHSSREYITSKMSKPELVKGQAAAYFRNVVTIQKEIKSAQAYICGLGYYEFYLNGEKVSDHVLDPAPSNYDKQAYYLKYDVSNFLKSGQNAAGILLGNGFYGQDISWKSDTESESKISFGQPAVKLIIKVTYEDGSTTEFFTDKNWKESTGPIVFNNIYGGDTYDARFELNGWDTIAYNDERWGNAKEVSPDVQKISAQDIPPIRALQEFTPQRVFKSSNGNWIVDFGQNIAGWVKINVREKEGQLIQITTTEALTQDGKDIFQGATGGGANGMPQIYEYICKGSGLESWEPKFSYHGFRYAEIKGVSQMPDSNMIKSVLVATDIEKKGSFTCSDPLLNKMDVISKWTIEGNIHGIPEDCPHREKCGWLGDAHAFCEYALYNYELRNFYKKYMEDIRTQMRPTKAFNNPETLFNVPTMIAPGRRTSTIAKLDWGVATMYLPWYYYKFSGDDSMIKEYYEEMKGLTNYYLSFKDINGIIQNGMGDWCPPSWDRQKNPVAMECDPIISANAYFYDILGVMQFFAKVTNDSAFESLLKKEQNALKIAFDAQFSENIPNTNFRWYGSQTATVMALQFGMVPDKDVEATVGGLVHDITVTKKGHHATGIHGGRYIYTVLSKYGKAKLAHEILTVPTFPSQTFVMNYGFTTWPERQFEWDKVPELTNSLNHPMHSGFAAYFYECLGGIKPSYESPGFKEFLVNPEFSEQITHTTVKVPTPYGSIENSWNIENNVFSMKLDVPFNTQARIVLTEKERSTLKINGLNFEQFRKMYAVQSVQSSSIALGSGKYTVQYEKTQP